MNHCYDIEEMSEGDKGTKYTGVEKSRLRKLVKVKERTEERGKGVKWTGKK
jgi:hypothetical protein